MSATRADRTAIRRTSLSRPVALALQDHLIHPQRTFFDYGCGRGDDLLRLQNLGIAVSGWDPAFFPDEERSPADVVNLGYVVNVIEEPRRRRMRHHAQNSPTTGRLNLAISRVRSKA